MLANGKRLRATGRSCQRMGCNAALRRSTILKGEPVPLWSARMAAAMLARTDMLLVLGCSMRESSSAGLYKLLPRGTPMVIVNLQPTQLDPSCALRIFAQVDVVMRALCSGVLPGPPSRSVLDMPMGRGLGVEPPPFRMQR